MVSCFYYVPVRPDASLAPPPPNTHAHFEVYFKQATPDESTKSRKEPRLLCQTGDLSTTGRWCPRQIPVCCLLKRSSRWKCCCRGASLFVVAACCLRSDQHVFISCDTGDRDGGRGGYGGDRYGDKKMGPGGDFNPEFQRVRQLDKSGICSLVDSKWGCGAGACCLFRTRAFAATNKALPSSERALLAFAVSFKMMVEESCEGVVLFCVGLSPFSSVTLCLPILWSICSPLVIKGAYTALTIDIYMCTDTCLSAWSIFV